MDSSSIKLLFPVHDPRSTCQVADSSLSSWDLCQRLNQRLIATSLRKIAVIMAGGSMELDMENSDEKVTENETTTDISLQEAPVIEILSPDPAPIPAETPASVLAISEQINAEPSTDAENKQEGGEEDDDDDELPTAYEMAEMPDNGFLSSGLLRCVLIERMLANQLKIKNQMDQLLEQCGSENAAQHKFYEMFPSLNREAQGLLDSSAQVVSSSASSVISSSEDLPFSDTHADIHIQVITFHRESIRSAQRQYPSEHFTLPQQSQLSVSKRECEGVHDESSFQNKRIKR